MGDFIMLAGLAVCVYFAVRALKNNKKKGGACRGNCATCSSCSRF